MKIIEKGTNITITQSVQDYLYKKLDTLSRFVDVSDESALCEVELGKTTNHHKNGEVFRTEINLHIKGKNLRAVSEMDDLFASIDIAKDEIVSSLKNHKDKKVSAVRRGGAKIKNLMKGFFNNNQA